MTPEEFANMAAFLHEAHTFQYSESYGIELSPLTKILNKLPFPGLHTVIMHSSVAVVNMNKIDELVKAIHNLSSLLDSNCFNKNVFKSLIVARRNTREFGKASPKFSIYYRFCDKLPLEIFSYNSRIDLYNFIELLRENVQNHTIKQLCSLVMEKINESISAIKRVTGDQSNGLNIYYPRQRILYNRDMKLDKLKCPYENLKFSRDTSWDEFLKKILFVQKPFLL
jgi:hypothetical protein